jgi:hypothetical protein
MSSIITEEDSVVITPARLKEYLIGRPFAILQKYIPSYCSSILRVIMQDLRKPKIYRIQSPKKECEGKVESIISQIVS